MTYQVAMIASDGWVLASDKLATIQGGIRDTYETEKIIYENGVASAPYGDECAQLVRFRVHHDLQVDRAKLFDGQFQRSMVELANGTWNEEYEAQKWQAEDHRIPAPRWGRGIIFLAPDTLRVAILSIGKVSKLDIANDKFIGGDSGNPARFLVQRYYDISKSTDQLSLLAAHTILQSARFNQMIAKLELWSWRKGDSDARWLDSAEYMTRSQELDRKLEAVIEAEMTVTR